MPPRSPRASSGLTSSSDDSSRAVAVPPPPPLSPPSAPRAAARGVPTVVPRAPPHPPSSVDRGAAAPSPLSSPVNRKLFSAPESSPKSFTSSKGHKRVALVPPGGYLPTRPKELSVLSLSCLSDFTARTAPFRTIPPLARKWKHRFPRLLDTIEATQADVVCLQDLDPGNKRFAWLREMRAMGYAGLLHDRRASGSTSAVGTFWKADRFHPTPLVVENKHRGLIISLQPSEASSAPLFVANMNLETLTARPHDRVHQLKAILASLARLTSDTPGGPKKAHVLLAGCLGSSRASRCYEFLSEGHLHEGAVDAVSGVKSTDRNVSHPFEFSEVYAEIPTGESIPYTEMDMTSAEARALGPRGVTHDFLFYSRHWHLEAALVPLTNADFALGEKGLPNMRNPSSHVPLGAVLRM